MIGNVYVQDVLSKFDHQLMLKVLNRKIIIKSHFLLQNYILYIIVYNIYYILYIITYNIEFIFYCIIILYYNIIYFKLKQFQLYLH